MAEGSLLRQAWILYRHGRFSAALEALEPKIFQHREDPEFFRVLGLCCLRLGDWKGGATYLQRTLQLEPSPHRDTVLGMMAVSAWRKDFGEAVQWGLQLLDQNPQDRTAKRAMDRLREALASPDDRSVIDAESIGRWLPAYRPPLSQSWIWAGRVGLIVVMAAGLVVGAWWGLSWVRGPGTPERPLPTEIAKTLGTEDLVQKGDGVALTLTADEVREGWARAQKAFQDYQDSRARYEINRLLLSNASPSIKERARGLIPFLHEPDFARPEDSSPYADVKARPSLYEGCTVRWSGVLANLVSGDTKISFDLLLGYQDGQVVEGIVPVELSFAALLKNSQVVEVLGRVALREGRWFLEASSLRDLGYRAP